MTNLKAAVAGVVFLRSKSSIETIKIFSFEYDRRFTNACFKYKDVHKYSREMTADKAKLDIDNSAMEENAKSKIHDTKLIIPKSVDDLDLMVTKMKRLKEVNLI